MTTRCVVLHSGGLDSTVCLLLARSRGRDAYSFGINYGQRQQIELEFTQCLKTPYPRASPSIKPS